jgi:hypothetical protein
VITFDPFKLNMIERLDIDDFTSLQR